MTSLVFHLITRGVIWNTIRGLFATLDVVVFTLFAWGMGLLFDITTVTTESDFGSFYKDIQSRIYLIMGIFMLFKILISLLTYLVNPDNITDKNQGAGKLVTRIVVSLILLIAFPRVFDQLNELQSDIIQSGTVQKLVLGSAGVDEPMHAKANRIALDAYNGVFFTDNNGNPVVIEGGASFTTLTIQTLVDHVNDPDGDNRNAYKYTYMPAAGTITGIIMAFLVFGMAIDIAIRVFKLIILQLIAPVPILSYIDPKQAKDGTFSKWLKMLISTWAEIFIKLFIIYFVILLIDKVLGGGIQSVDGSPLVKISLIIGLLFFAKQAPKFICDAMGIKAPEKGGIGSMFAKAALGGVAGLGVGAAAGLVSGGVGGMAAGALNGLNGGFHGNKVGDTLKQGLDLGTQVRSGGEQTKWKNMLQKAQETSMQHSAARKLGYSSIKEANDAFGDIKKAKEKAEGIYAAAESAYQSGGSYTYQGRKYSGDNLRNLIYGDNGLRVNSLKATSKFNDFSAHLGAYGMGSKVDSSLKKAREAKDNFSSNTYVTDSNNFDWDDRGIDTASASSSTSPASSTTTVTSPPPSRPVDMNQGDIDYTQQYASPASSQQSNSSDVAGDFMEDIMEQQRNG